MSHELRTPLNSLLILSDQLSRNPDGNLTPKQTEFATTIHASGKDLLNLINDILDLSKIESGTVVVDVGEVQLGDLMDYVERTFRHVAEAKGVEFQLEPGRGVPPTVSTDAKRLQQVIKNLLSNAFKFTERGSVSLKVERARGGWGPDAVSLDNASSVVAFSVTDTGIGISADKQQIIFEAFQQADGSTSRKYGGTGLGLAISREIARLLGGEIRLSSVPGQGSTFTLYLPQSYAAPKTVRATTEEGTQEIVSVMSDVDAVRRLEPTMLEPTEIPDDRAEISHEDRVLLIIDNDENFARFLLDMAHENGFKGLVATRGASGIDLAHQYRVDAITLDIQLPFISGWRVLDRLKTDLATRHIPVYVITTEEDTQRGVSLGAIGTLTKPIKTKEALDRVFSEIRSFIEPAFPPPARHFSRPVPSPGRLGTGRRRGRRGALRGERGGGVGSAGRRILRPRHPGCRDASGGRPFLGGGDPQAVHGAEHARPRDGAARARTGGRGHAGPADAHDEREGRAVSRAPDRPGRPLSPSPCRGSPGREPPRRSRRSTEATPCWPARRS